MCTSSRMPNRKTKLSLPDGSVRCIAIALQVIHRRRAVAVRLVDPSDGREYNTIRRSRVLQHRPDTLARYGAESLKDLE
jgi:hypothetical protein